MGAAFVSMPFWMLPYFEPPIRCVSCVPHPARRIRPPGLCHAASTSLRHVGPAVAAAAVVDAAVHVDEAAAWRHFYLARYGQGQKPVPPVNIPIPTKID